MNARKNFRTRPKENIIANITPPPMHNRNLLTDRYIPPD